MTLEQHLILRKEFADKPDIWTEYLQKAKDILGSLKDLQNTVFSILMRASKHRQ